jgi:RNA polymerase sigma-70 factor (sigma-E family)
VKQASSAPEPATPSSADRDEFADFYRREYARSMRLAWLLTGSQPAAEDVVQDAMTSVYAVYDRVLAPAAYLRKAVVNGARSRWRHERRRRDWTAEPGLERAEFDADELGLLHLVGQLPYRQRAVIVARYWGGWSEREIAAALGCRPGTVKSLASRALDHLRSEVER